MCVYACCVFGVCVCVCLFVCEVCISVCVRDLYILVGKKRMSKGDNKTVYVMYECVFLYEECISMCMFVLLQIWE